MTTARQVVQTARSWLGVRWRHQGRDRNGVDCLGLNIQILHEHSLTTFDKVDYARQATDETMLTLCHEHLTPISRLELGCVVVMAYGNQRHMGLIGDYPLPNEWSLIHAALIYRKVVEHRLDSAWERRIVGRFRIPGLEPEHG